MVKRTRARIGVAHVHAAAAAWYIPLSAHSRRLVNVSRSRESKIETRSPRSIPTTMYLTLCASSAVRIRSNVTSGNERRGSLASGAIITVPPMSPNSTPYRSIAVETVIGMKLVFPNARQKGRPSRNVTPNARANRLVRSVIQASGDLSTNLLRLAMMSP